jgi:DNA modification methylase
MDWRHMGELLAAGERVYAKLQNVCVWDKGQGGMGALYRSQHELVFLFKHGTAPHLNQVELGRHGRNRTNVWRYPGANRMRPGGNAPLALHPTVKPVAMIAEALLDASSRGGIVLDGFGGSGSTLVAAERSGRRARIMELDPHYVDLTIARYCYLTGGAAVHQASELTFERVKVEREEKM